ncbi:Hypothetical predicted protein [Cloeon dipterum]|uniref:Uncharacterized protein n=1 Tax=Cloeon dipterum TaxID=197152 RepID=A0A8S1DKE2_9INSE|nr:Hypothetical predicted protein [Cloeon dipterum]
MESPLMPRILPKFPKSNFQRILDRILHANKLADFTAFKNTPEDFKTKQQESFQFVESTFPFYIRPEHHVMSLLVPGNSKGEYWGDAAHFLLSNKAHGFPLWSEFEKQIRSTDTKISCMPHISTNMTKLILKHEQHHQLDQADGAWFASSPFVLAQLPFQPVLLFQWLTQSLFLLSNFEMQMRYFYAIPVTARFKPHLMSLHKLLKTTQRNIGFLFDYLQQQVESKQEIFVGNLKVFEIILNGVLPFLTFWNEKNGHLYVSNLIMKCWEHCDTDGEIFKLERGSMAFKKRNFLFNPDFWRGPSENLRLFGNSNEYLVRGRKDLPDDTTWRKAMKDWNINIETKVNEITKSARKKHHDYDYLMKNNLEFKKRMKKVKRRSSGLAVEPRDSRILGFVLNVNTLIELEIAIWRALFYIAEEYNISPANIVQKCGLYDNIDIDTIESLLSDLNYHYTNYKSLSEFGNEYSVSTIKLTDSLDIQYEVRCQNIVSQCIGAHLNIENFEKEKDNAMRDWQVVQFLLPCFISLYRVITAAEDSQNDLRQWYEKFLDKLISTFEDEKVGVRRSSWANILKDIQNNPDLLSENTHEELLKFFDRVSNKFITKVKICQTAFDHLARCGFFRAFYEVLETNYGKNKKSSAQSNDIATKPSVYWNWLMWDFFDRMEQAMKEAK